MNRRFALSLLLLLACSPFAAAHPLPNMRYDRTVAVRLTPDGVVVKYTLEVGWFTMHLDGAKLLTPDEIAKLDKTEKGFAAVYAKKLAPIIAHDLRPSTDGKPMTLRVDKIDIDILDHLKCNFTFKADWPAGGKKRAFVFEDESLEGKPGIINLTLDRADFNSGVTLAITEEPPPGLRNRPSIELKPGEEKKLRKAAADVELPRDIVAPTTETPPAETAVSVTDDAKPSLFGDLSRRGLPALFDSRFGWGILMLAAFLFGAAHAFTPGHGKTLVAAYLVGERGTVKHAVILGFATTIAHTGSVIAIAAILWGVYGNNVPSTAQGVLQFAGGFLVAGVGLWLLLRRISGKADHFHFHSDGHHHHHDHDHSHHHHHGPPPESAKSTAGWTRLILMGLGGGIVPCWDAVLLLIAAVSLNQVAFAVPLLFAFSAGLGAVLVMLGVGVVWAHKRGAVKFKESRWFRALPMVSAVLLVLVGFWLCQEGLRAAMR